MDYKELIANIRKIAGGLKEDNAQKCAAICESAADAIETLLTERDAAVKQLSNDGCRCCSCIYYNRTLNDHPCNHCNETGGMTDYWQWRGPQKEGG